MYIIIIFTNSLFKLSLLLISIISGGSIESENDKMTLFL